MTVFVSHSSIDGEFALDLVQAIETDGHSCWIAPRNVTPGSNFAAEIMQGIESCGLFLLLHSASANASPHVLREVGRASNRGRPMLVLRADDTPMSEALEYFVGGLQWVSVRGLTAAQTALHVISALDPQSQTPTFSDKPPSPLDQQSEFLSQIGYDVVELVLEASDRGRGLPSPELVTRLAERNPKLYANLTTAALIVHIKDAETRGFCPGLQRVEGGYAVAEPHISFKTKAGAETKALLAAGAAEKIKSGMRIGFDGGSTTLAVFEELLTKIAEEQVGRLTIVTNSMSIVSRACEFTAAHGLNDANSPLAIFVIGGRLRAITAAVECTGRRFGQAASRARDLLREVGKLDMSFVGANGITLRDGLTIPTPNEVPVKRRLLELAREPFVVADGNKFGLKFDNRLAGWQNRIRLITTQPATPDGISELQRIQSSAAFQKIEIV